MAYNSASSTTRRSAAWLACSLPLLFGILLATVGRGVLADDWPGWRGPNRNGVCEETGLLKEWPAEGPPLAWQTRGLGEGYSGPAVVGNLLYLMGQRDGQEWVFALDWTKRGQVAWATPIGPVRHNGGGYPGPRCTPTIDGRRVYVLGVAGTLACLDARTGRGLWQCSLPTQFGGQVPQWGYAESVLIDGDKLICTPGGSRATMLALDKDSGRPAWQASIGDQAAYSSPIKVSIGRVIQYVNLTEQGVIAVDAQTGRLLWRWDRPANRTANVPTCVWFGQTVFAASGYGTGGGLVWARRTASGFETQELYFTNSMKNHHGGMVLVDEHLYGADDPGQLTCINYRTGEVLWQDRRPGKCSVLYADGMLYCRNENGPMTLVEANPSQCVIRGQFQQPSRSDRKAWPHPVIANGMLFLRDDDLLLCYDVRQSGSSPTGGRTRNGRSRSRP